MNRNCRPQRIPSCYEAVAIEAFVQEKMTQTLTFTAGACHGVGVDLTKGRFAQLITPCYVPEGRDRLFACRYGVHNAGRGVRYLLPMVEETDFERLFGLFADDTSIFQPAKPFYGEGGAIVQGKPLFEIVLAFGVISNRPDLSRNDRGYVPMKIDGVLPLSALPAAKGHGRRDFYRSPFADCDGPA